MDKAILAFGDVECFTKGQFEMLSGSTPQSAAVTLSRWAKEGKVVPLRRGMFTLSDKVRRKELGSERVANLLVQPSYLSSLWAMSKHGVIPEMVVEFTSVSCHPTASFENAFGRYSYQSIDDGRFFGYKKSDDGVFIAVPEKALIDYLYLRRRTISWDELSAELRIQKADMDLDTLADLTVNFGVDSVSRMVEEISEKLEEEEGQWQSL